MEVQCGDNLEAKLMYFILKDENWTSSILELSEIPFFRRPQRIRKRRIFISGHNALINSAWNQVIDLVTSQCAEMGPMEGWLVFLFLQSFSF